MVLASQRASQKFRGGLKRSVPRAALDSEERRNAEHVWRMQMGRRAKVDDVVELMQLLERLQVPMQPMIRHVVEGSFDEHLNAFGFTEFCFVLEQCKTLHSRWLAKVKGKKIDDEVLEAFIAVGGSVDSTGEVDLDLMDKIVNDFGLVLPELKDRRPPAASQPSSPQAAASPDKPPASPRSLRKDAAQAPLEFDNFVALLRGRYQDESTLMNIASTYISDHDLDEGAEDDPHASSHLESRSNSRRQSMSNLRRQTHVGSLPPLSTTPQPAATANPHNNQVPADRANSSLGKSNANPTSPTSKTRGATKLPPLVNRQKKEKRHKFANW